MSFVHLAEPYNLGELVVLQSLLEGSGIEYVIRHAHMGSLYPGVPGMNSHVMVDEHDYSRAELLLQRLRVDVREVSEEAEDSR